MQLLDKQLQRGTQLGRIVWCALASVCIPPLVGIGGAFAAPDAAPAAPPSLPSIERKYQPVLTQKEQRWPKLSYGGYLSGAFRYRTRGAQLNDEADSDTGFQLRFARFKVQADFGKHFVAKLGLEAARLVDPTSEQDPSDSAVTNAYFNYAADPLFQIRVGRFKRPFSRLALSRVLDLPFRGRGLGDSRFVVRANWGDRNQGVMLWGRRQDKKLRWALSASSPGFGEDGVDLHARTSVRPIDEIDVGLSGAYKLIDDPTEAGSDNFISLWALGADFRLKFKKLRWVTDAYLAQDARSINEEGHPMTAAVTSYLSYSWKLKKGLKLKPTFVFEWVDADLEFAESEAVRAVISAPAFFALKGKNAEVSVMPQIEWIIPQGEGTIENPNPWRQQQRLQLVSTLDF